MRKILKLFLLFGFALNLLLPAFPANAAAATAAKVIITEIKLGGGSDVTFSDGSSPAKDFVTLYNQSSQPVPLVGWSLQYAKAGANFADCNAQFASASITQLNGTLQPGAASTPIKRSMNDATDGALRLIDGTGLVNDLVGWGLSTKCYDSSPSTTPANGKSLQRYIDCHSNAPVDTDNNLSDFTVSDVPSPGVLAGPITTDCFIPEPPTDNQTDSGDNTGGQGSGPQNSCSGVIISELLANPAGSDTNHEFIELYNPTGDIILFAGCKLQTSANTKIFEFTDDELQPGQYKAFYNDQTGLALANSSGGTVYLIDTDNTEIDQADYGANLDDDVSWSLIGGKWQSTYTATPDKPNELLATKPCPSGQIRNPDTNRCVNIVTEAAGLGPCAPGKKRNPATNRCRLITSFASILKACAPNQVRNPLTNRCKKIGSSNSLVPCKPGQARNPETNRCKKILSLSSGGINDVKDVLSQTSQTSRSVWVMAGVSVSIALLYAVWEWRNEITERLGILKGKFNPTISP